MVRIGRFALTLSVLLVYGAHARAQNEFNDSLFRIFDNGDSTKKIAFEASGISTGTTRTLTPQNSNYTLAGTNISQTFSGTQTFSGQISLTGTTYPNLKHEPGTYPTLLFTDPRPAPWQIIRGSTAAPINTISPGLFINQVSVGNVSGDGFTSALKVYNLVQSGGTLGSSAAFFALQNNTSFPAGIAPVAIHAAAKSNATGGNVMGAWIQSFDGGLNSGAGGIEVNTQATYASRTMGQNRGINVVDFPYGTNAQNDWGILIEHYGHGLVINPGNNTATTAFKAVFIRNQAGATNNAKTKILDFESPQPGPFAVGLDFTNATFTQAAIKTGSSSVVQFGKIGNVSGSNNIAGVASFSAQASKSVTFTSAYVVAPICVGTPQFNIGAAIAGPWVTSTTASVTVNFSAAVTGNVNYVCVANPN